MNTFFNYLKIKYPRNYLVDNPFSGALFIAAFCFIFLTLYKPLNAHAGKSMSYAATMGIYSLGTGISVIVFTGIMNLFRWFSDIKEWTVFKEMVSVLLEITAIGTVIYLLGFIVEPPENRADFKTFLDSLKGAFLLGIIPFTFFSAMNYRHLLSNADEFSTSYSPAPVAPEQPGEMLIQIASRLKKEELSFYPDQFIYAESDGNYVTFHLKKEGSVKKVTIRNSISNIAMQLDGIEFFFRTHRAFIVNLKKVKSKQGNILGYQLKLTESDSNIPVSRNNIKDFDRVFAGWHS